MTDLNLKLVLQALDRGASPTVRRFTATVHGLSNEVKAAPRGWNALTTSIGRTTNVAERFNTAGRQNARTLDALIERQQRLRREGSLTDALASRQGRRAPGGGGGVIAGLAGGAGALIGLGLASAGGFAVRAGVMGGRRVLDEGARRDSLTARLAMIEKTGEAAKSSLSWIDRFSVATNQDLDGVTNAYIRLKKKGIDPTGGALVMLGDSAKANGKSLEATVEMFLDAQRGQFGALDDYGIQARKVGRQVVFSWDQDGKRMTATSARTAAGVRKTLSDILIRQDKGAMDKDAGSWDGMIGRLAKRRDSFLGLIAAKGLMESAKGQVGRFLAFLDKAASDGRLEAWAEKIATGLTSAAGAVNKFGEAINWGQLAKDIGTLARMIEKLAGAWQSLEALNNSPVMKFLNRFSPGGQASQAFQGLAMVTGADPRGQQALARASAGAGRAVESTRNPWASGAARQTLTASGPPVLGGTRPVDALARPQQPFAGKLEISLAPGLMLGSKSSTGGLDLTERRGFTGSRP